MTTGILLGVFNTTEEAYQYARSKGYKNTYIEVLPSGQIGLNMWY